MGTRFRLLWERRALVALAIVIGTATCGGLDTFEVEETTTTQVPAGTPLDALIGDLGFGDFLNFDITEKESFRNQGVERHEIDSVTVGMLRLTVTDPEGGDLSFLEELSFFAEARELEKVRIAHGTDFPPGVRSVELELDDVELADYAAAPSMDLTTEVRGGRPSQRTTVEAQVVLLVDVDVGGVLCGK